MASVSQCKNQILMKERLLINMCNPSSVFFYTAFLTIVLTFYLLYFPRTNTVQEYNQTKIFTPPYENGSRSCNNLFKGEWIPEERESLYTNFSCKTIPYRRNCFFHGRKDRDFVQWRWKPEECELPRFSSKTFLSIVRGKTMAFIGDSLARNQMDSLLCLLSTEETPKEVYKDAEDRSMTWEFPKHNFTLMALWSQFLVTATQTMFNGSATGGFDLHLDKVDQNWSEKLRFIDYAIFSDVQWFFRQHYLYEGSNLIGCILCQVPNMTDLGLNFAIKRAFRAAFKQINECKNCKNIFTVLRTFSPSHFENGAWNTGGGCNRTRPVRIEDVIGRDSNWELRKIQVKEIEMAREKGEYLGNKFEILDITEIMGMRPDGHPGLYGGNTWMTGYSDCIHWCLPGPIDVWNELLLEMIKRQTFSLV